PNAGVRIVETDQFCIGSPQRTPHVVVQQLIAAKSERLLELPLGPGNYRLPALELPGSQPVNVSPAGAASVAVKVDESGWSDEVINVSERSAFSLSNQTDAE